MKETINIVTLTFIFLFSQIKSYDGKRFNLWKPPFLPPLRVAIISKKN